VSGGGGWGKKQGLLALDSQVRFDPSGEDEMQALVRSLDPEAKQSQEKDLIRAGSSVQFFISPSKSFSSNQEPTCKDDSTVEFGVTTDANDGMQTPALDEAMCFKPGVFGGLSCCMFVENGQGSGYSKVDVPQANWLASLRKIYR